MSKEKLIKIDPLIIYFTHSKIRNRFTGCNKLIEETKEEIIKGETKITDIPKIMVYYDGEKYYSQNNRRLWLFKSLKNENRLDEIEVRLQYCDKKKFSNKTMSLTAKMMNEKANKTDNNEEEEIKEEEDINEESINLKQNKNKKIYKNEVNEEEIIKNNDFEENVNIKKKNKKKKKSNFNDEF
jgi:hypothetical protein